ncbi:MAG: hydroxymethylglutaryl-CoA synthase [Lactobacillaceae bacterium]|jgi:hydroxymethylglutaryl-CoA synthase|nr:hydroxymethylglutaryl-CoA synthase [Lactobacillaceae bacterium]
MTVGIDAISFFTPEVAIDLVELAKVRGVDPDKYTIGIGQVIQSVVPKSQDSVSMAANAANFILANKDEEYLNSIDGIYFASESGIDNSKSGAVILKQILNLKSNIRTIELKQACYGGTFGLISAFNYVTLNPDKKILVVASDIARYGLKTAGEVTQGAGAIAMIVSSNPTIAEYNFDSVYKSEDLMDFWRPIYSDTAFVDGKYSQDVYKEFFSELWNKYNKPIDDFTSIAFHLPFSKMGNKALDQVLNDDNKDKWHQKLEIAKMYSKQVGNLYTGSVYLALLSILENASLQANSNVAIFSFGSGAEAELFSIKIKADYKNGIFGDTKNLLNNRRLLDIATYESIFLSHNFNGSNELMTNEFDHAKFQLREIKDNQRIYS